MRKRKQMSKLQKKSLNKIQKNPENFENKFTEQYEKDVSKQLDKINQSTRKGNFKWLDNISKRSIRCKGL